MKPIRLILFLFPFLFFQNGLDAQKRLDEDSLWKVYHNLSAPDTERLGAIHNLSWQMVFVNPDSSIALAKLEMDLAKQKKSNRYLADANNTIGVAYISLGDFKSALLYNQNALTLREGLHDKKLEAVSLNNLGTVYNYMGDVSSSIDYYKRSLKLKLEINDMAGVAAAYSNLGQIYSKEKMDDKSLQYFLMSLHLRDSLQDQRGLEDSYTKLAAYYGDRKDYEKSKEYTLKSIDLSIALNHRKTLSNNLENLGLTFYKTNQSDSAEKYFQMALQIRTELKDDNGISDSYFDLGNLRLDLGDYENAITFCSKSLTLAESNDDAQQQQDDCGCLATAWEHKGDFKKALTYLKRSNLINDSLNTLEKSKNISRKILQYEYEKRTLADSLRITRENEVKDIKRQEEVRQQKIYTVAGVIAFLLMLIIAFVLLRGYRLKQKNNEALEIKNKIITEQKMEVENQKALVDEKNKAVLDSINYAQRLQSAILPSEKSWLDCFPESFIFYRPKDIVAGDFYWFEISSESGVWSSEKNKTTPNSELRTKNSELILFAAADCTGHGVPGALVSVVCSNALNRAVKEFGLIDPGKILDKVTELVQETFEKSQEDVSDGMDISICCLDKKTNTLHWAGANNPLWIVQDGETKISEWKADKQPVGQFDNRHPFTTHTIVLKPNSTLYLFTDGYADQFGGVHGKKFKYKQFAEKLLSVSNLKMEEQKKVLGETFDSWKGNLERVDDVCVIGIKI